MPSYSTQSTATLRVTSSYGGIVCLLCVRGTPNTMLTYGQHHNTATQHTVRNSLTHKVIIPRALSWDHKETQKSIREQHLDLLIVRWQVTMWVVASVFVVATPLIAKRSQLVGSKGAGARGEAGRETRSHSQGERERGLQLTCK